MEKVSQRDETHLSSAAQRIAAQELGCEPTALNIVAVSGGYSLNRRALVEYNNTWLFAKEVDTEVLSGDGLRELAWLKKDYDMSVLLRPQMPELVPAWSKLSADGHTLLMTSYRAEDGWVWSLPSEKQQQTAYIQAVIDAVHRLEVATFDNETIERLQLQPYFRDKLAFDEGMSAIRGDGSIRHRLIDIYEVLRSDETLAYLHESFHQLEELLANPHDLEALTARAQQLHDQPEVSFNHCDVRSDNIAYNTVTHQVVFVDWNWASFAPTCFGTTEFLIDMARNGVDVRPWLDDLNTDMLAAIVGLYARRCLEPPLAPGSTLRKMQAQSAAVALNLYSMTQTANNSPKQ